MIKKIIASVVIGFIGAKISMNIALNFGLNLYLTGAVVLTYIIALYTTTILVYKLITNKESRNIETITLLPIPILVAINTMLILILMIKHSAPVLPMT